MYFETIQQFIKMLGNLESLIGKAVQHAEAKKFEVDNFVAIRLTPDMFPFARQVQVACDMAKSAASNLSGKENPRFEDNEKTIPELRERIQKTIAYLKSFSAADFQDCGRKKVKLSFPQGKAMYGEELLIQRSVPNFYFHITAAYAILRQGGVEIGKRDYIGELPLFDA